MHSHKHTRWLMEASLTNELWDSTGPVRTAKGVFRVWGSLTKLQTQTDTEGSWYSTTQIPTWLTFAFVSRYSAWDGTAGAWLTKKNKTHLFVFPHMLCQDQIIDTMLREIGKELLMIFFCICNLFSLRFQWLNWSSVPHGWLKSCIIDDLFHAAVCTCCLFWILFLGNKDKCVKYHHVRLR